MKRVLVLFIALFFMQTSFADSMKATVKDSILKLADDLAKEQSSDGYFQGEFEGDPLTEAAVLMVGKRTGLITSEQEQKLLKRVTTWKWKTKTGWPLYPGGATNFHITYSLLHMLKDYDVDSVDQFKTEWNWLRAQGKSLIDLHFLHRGMLHIAGVKKDFFVSKVTPIFFALPKWTPMNIINIGTFRSAGVPLAVANFYQRVNESGHKGSLIEQSRIDSAGEAFGKGSSLILGVSELPSFILNTGFESIVEGTINLAKKFSRYPEDFWAQEGLGYLLKRQEKDGTWYGVPYVTLMSIWALYEADRAGVADYSAQMKAGWDGMFHSWWIDADQSDSGEGYLQVSDGPIVDTARGMAVIAESEKITETTLLPLNSKARAIDWLIKLQPIVDGDYKFTAPDLKPGGWGFQHANTFYPDTDDTGMVLTALASNPVLDVGKANTRWLESIKKGMDWEIGMQNSDGGFPAYEKGMSTLLSEIAKMDKRLPSYFDVSQPDVTARALEGLVFARNATGYNPPKLKTTINSACSFLERKLFKPFFGIDIVEGDWGINYIYGTTQAIIGLLDAKCWTKANRAQRHVRWLVEKQNIDGGWGEDPISDQKKYFVSAKSSMTATVWAIRMLARFESMAKKDSKTCSVLSLINRCPTRYTKALEKGVRWLVDFVEKNPTVYEPEFTGILVKEISYCRYGMGGRYEAIRALSLYYQLLK